MSPRWRSVPRSSTCCCGQCRAEARPTGGMRFMTRKSLSMFDPTLVRPALVDALRKLEPRVQLRNPVMFVVYAGSIFTTLLWLQALGGKGEAPAWFIGLI